MKIVIEQYINNGWISLIVIENENLKTTEDANEMVSKFAQELADNGIGIMTSKEHIVVANLRNGPVRFTVFE